MRDAMTCSELDDRIEAIADGGYVPSPVERTHLDTCARCAQALALAAAVHRALARQPAPVPPPRLAATILAAVRRERWRSEQYLDLAFNVVVGLAVLAGVAGLWIVMSASGLAVVSADLVRLFAGSVGMVVARMTPALPLYAGATALVVTGLTVWWWAERGFEI